MSRTHAERLARCRHMMRKAGIAAYLVTSQKDGFYLAGFTGEDSAILVTPREVHVLTDGRFVDVARKDCPWARHWIRRGSLNDEIANACKKLRLRKVAVQPAHRTLADHADLRKRAKGTRLPQAPPIVSDMRRLKDAGELAIMRQAIRIAEASFAAVRKTVRIGDTELELAARLEYEMKCRGASGPAFATICAEGSNAAIPHAHAGKRKVREGSLILFDWGARWGGYCSDLTRVIFVGSIASRHQAVYSAVLKAQEKAIAALRPGAKMCDVDEVARGYLKSQGLGERFTHGLGHGLGLDVHEPPSLSWRSSEKLEAGMVVTVEPGVYWTGVGGVRIEDDVLVTPDGAKVLSRISKSLDDAVLRG